MKEIKSIIKTIFNILFFIIIGFFGFVSGAIKGSKWN